MARSTRGIRPAQTRWLGVGVGLMLAALVGLVLVGLRIWTRPSPPPPAGDPSRQLVVFFGDSITAGYTLPPEQAFPHLIGQALGVPVRNAGVNGETTAGALGRIERDVLAWRPRVVVVELGANDFFRRRPVAETLENLETVVRRVRADGAAVVLIHIRLGLLADPYLPGYRRLARQEGTFLVEDFLGEIPRTASLTLDGLHPNAEGHRRLADRLLPVLSRLLGRPGGDPVAEGRPAPLGEASALSGALAERRGSPPCYPWEGGSAPLPKPPPRGCAGKAGARSGPSIRQPRVEGAQATLAGEGANAPDRVPVSEPGRDGAGAPAQGDPQGGPAPLGLGVTASGASARGAEPLWGAP